MNKLLLALESSDQGLFTYDVSIKCDSTFARKSEGPIHINENHKKCSICEQIFTNTKVLQTHMKAVNKKEISKHTIEREPSLKNHIIKKTA